MKVVFGTSICHTSIISEEEESKLWDCGTIYWEQTISSPCKQLFSTMLAKDSVYLVAGHRRQQNFDDQCAIKSKCSSKR